MGSAVVFLVDSILGLIALVILVWAVCSWLIAFDVINRHNRVVDQILRTLDALVYPLLRPIRKIVPPLGGVDLSPIVLILLVEAVRIAFDRLLAPLLIGLFL